MRSSDVGASFVRLGAIGLLAAACAAGCDGATEPLDTYPQDLRIEAVTDTVVTGTVRTEVTPAPTVRATDQLGRPLAGVPVSFRVATGGGTIAHHEAQTSGEGMASVGRWILGTSAGPQTVTAHANGLMRVTFSVEALPGPVARVSPWGGDHQEGPVGSALPGPLLARVTDRYDNPIAGATVTFTVTAGAGSIDGGTATSDSDGFAASGLWTLGSAVGVQGVRAQTGNVRAVFTAYARALPPPCVTDCGTIAFVSSRDGNAEIYSVNPDGTDLTRLTNDPAADEQPAWSPDGRRIAFVSSRNGGSEVYVMDADGSNVVRRTFSSGYNRDPSWSPDASMIAYSARRLVTSDDPSDFGSECGEWSSDLWVVSPEATGPGPRLLLSTRGELSLAYEPSWSPDGTRLALVVQNYEVREDCEGYGWWGSWPQNIFLVNADGSGVTALTTGDVDYSAPAWSPRGEKLAFVMLERHGRGGARIGVMSSDGNALTPLAASAQPWLGVSWSPDGRLIAFTGAGNGVSWVDADGSDSGLIVSNGWDPDWRR
jgi:Tol biopolymer transport system component